MRNAPAEAVILLCRSARGRPGGLEPLAAAVSERLGLPTRVAMLDGGEPGLADALTELADHDEIVVVPAHLPADRDLMGWARRVIGHWIGDRARRPVVRLAAPLEEHELVVSAVCAAVSGPASAVTDQAAPLLSPLWEQIPGFRHHLLICRGPRCSTQGATEVSAAFERRLRERGLGDDDVLVTLTGCLFPCSLGPVAVVHPDDVWYGDLDPEAAAAIVDQHLVDGQLLQSKARRRTAD